MNRTNAPGSFNGFYVDEDRDLGRAGTAIVAADRNAIQNEIVNLIESSGLAPSALDDAQLAQATTRIVLAARAAAGRNIVGSGVASGFEVSIVGTTLNVALGAGWDTLGRRLALAAPAVVDLAGSVSRPSVGNVKWVSFVARATNAVANGTIDVGPGNQPHQYEFADECIVVAIEGVEVADPAGAVRPASGEDLLLADVLVDNATAWNALAIDLTRRVAVVKNDSIEDRIRAVAAEVAKEQVRKSNQAILPGLMQATGYKVAAPDAATDDLFGDSVAVDGDYAIVGAYGDDHAGMSFGSAWVFHRISQNSWDGGTKLTAPDAAAFDWFGTSVAISGDYAVVGVEKDDDSGSDSGSAWVFRRTAANSWNDAIKLVAPDAAAGDYFGRSVAISGDYIIIGAYQDDDSGSDSGSAWVFRRTGENAWGDATKLVAPDGAANDRFGFATAISGDYAIVGAFQDDDRSGSAWIFRRTGENTWDSGTKLVAPDAAPDDSFGHSVALNGDYAIVGVFRDDYSGSDLGSAWVFRRTGPNNWDGGTKLVAPDAATDDLFGFSVDISRQYAIVGAVRDDDFGSDSGSAWLFRRTGENTWDRGTKLVSSDRAAGSGFGRHVAASEDHVIVGANSGSSSVTNSGAAYIYQNLLKVANDALDA